MNLLKGSLCLLFSSISLLSQSQTIQDAIQFYKYNRFESAKKILTPLAATDPQANYYLGLCELATENTATAKSIFEKYPEDNANNAGLARVYFEEKKTTEAMALLNKVSSKAKKKDYMPLKYAADAITYTNGGDPNVAVEWYKKAMDIEKTGDLHIAIGDAYRKIIGGGGNAMTNYEYAEMMNGYQSLANYKMGNLWYAAKNYDSALSKYARSSSSDAANPLPYKALADAYYRIKKFKLSKENIEKYLELSDKTTDDQIQYANTLYLSKEYGLAISKMNELISKGVEKPYMYRVIGFSQLELKEYANAKQSMDKFFAKQDPAKVIPQDHINYGKLLLKDSTTIGLAKGSFEKGIQSDTSADKSAVYREIAEACKDAQAYTDAASWYKRTIETNAPSVDAIDFWWCGVMYYYAGDYVSAEPMLNKMIEKYPTEPTGYLWLARNTAQLKDKDYKNGAAVEQFNKWLGMVNDDPTKKNDHIKAYTYLMWVNYQQKNKAETDKYSNKLLQFDATNKKALEIRADIATWK